MDGNHLSSHREIYLEDPDGTSLNTVDIWTSESELSSTDDERVWVMLVLTSFPRKIMLTPNRYIHGGAWRDPEVDSRSFELAIYIFCTSPLKSAVAGFAAINYRLSPYPSHPKDPSSPDDKSRNVHYPSHLLDVSRALLYLDNKYGINNRYILAGHSAGATLAFELNNWHLPDSDLPQPACVLGISGIYDLEAFIGSHSEIPVYRELVENAFPDKSLWEQASPNKSNLPRTAKWQDARAIIVSHSDEDELVEKAQASYMLERARLSPNAKAKVHFLQATGTHDEIWKSGHILADLISKSINILRSSPKDTHVVA
jgi:acetyl esterase/lipase